MGMERYTGLPAHALQGGFSFNVRMEVIQQGRAMLYCAFKKNLFAYYCEEWTVKGKREAGRQGASRSGRRGWIGTILRRKAQQALVMGCLLEWGVGKGEEGGPG